MEEQASSSTVTGPCEEILRGILCAKWEIVNNNTGSIVRSGSSTICLNPTTLGEGERMQYSIGFSLASRGIGGSVGEQTVRIQNNNSFDVDIWIGENRSYTEETLNANSTLVWKFVGLHIHTSSLKPYDTHHWAEVKREGRSLAKFSVYGNGNLGHAPNDNNTFQIGKSKITSSFFKGYPVNFN